MYIKNLRDHYRYVSRTNSRISILTVTFGKECSRRSVLDDGELSRGQSVHNPRFLKWICDNCSNIPHPADCTSTTGPQTANARTDIGSLSEFLMLICNVHYNDGNSYYSTHGILIQCF